MNNYNLAPIQANSIREFLAEQGIKSIDSINVFPSLTSTNDYFKQKEFDSKSEISICISEEQTNGRGRFGHQWQSPAGVNLYLSMLWPLTEWNKQYETLALRLLIAVAELLEELSFDKVQLKWPNDICVQNKKLGGILIERITRKLKEKLIIGLGINVAMSKYENVQLDTPWVDLISINPNWTMSRNEFSAYIIASLYKYLISIGDNSFEKLSSLWKRYDLLAKQKIEFTYKDKRIEGMAHGIDDNGQLIVEVNKEMLRLHSAYVSDITL